MPVQLNAAASTALVVFYVILSLLLVVILGALVVALSRLNAKLEELSARVEPLLTKTEGLLSLANEKAVTLGDSAERILSHGEVTAATVQDRVGRTAATVQRTVNAPIVGLNSLFAGLSQGVSTFTRLQSGGARTPQRRVSSPVAQAAAAAERPATREAAEEAVTGGAAVYEVTATPTSDETRERIPVGAGRP